MDNAVTDADLVAALNENKDEDVETDPKVLVIDGFEPIEANKERFAELELREPTVFPVMESSKIIGQRPTLETIYDAQIDLVHRISNWPTKALYQLPTRVLDRAIVFVTGFEDEARRKVEEEPDLSDELVLPFSPAIEAVNRSYADMRLREPSVVQRRAFKSQEAKGTPFAYMRAEFALVEAISGWHAAAIMKMPISKFAKAADYCTGFFTSGPKIGSSFPLT